MLAQIQDMYGTHNTEDQVFFSDANEAVLFVTDQNGDQVLMTVLTNLGAWYAEGVIKSVEELRTQWLSTG